MSLKPKDIILQSNIHKYDSVLSVGSSAELEEKLSDVDVVSLEAISSTDDVKYDVSVVNASSIKLDNVLRSLPTLSQLTRKTILIYDIRSYKGTKENLYDHLKKYSNGYDNDVKKYYKWKEHFVYEYKNTLNILLTF